MLQQLIYYKQQLNKEIQSTQLSIDYIHKLQQLQQLIEFIIFHKMNKRKTYQAPLDKISEVSSPTLKHSQQIDINNKELFHMTQSYTSFFKIRQERQQQLQKKNAQQLLLKQNQIQRYQQQVMSLKVEINKLEQILQNYRYTGNCNSEIFCEIMDIVSKWIKNPIMKESRKYILETLLMYFSKKKKDNEWLVYGRILILLIQIYESVQKSRQSIIK